MKTIVVLEDMAARLLWLRELVGRVATIKSTDNVGRFMELVVEMQPDLVILDHDLGLGRLYPEGLSIEPDHKLTPESYDFAYQDLDTQGMNGSDAAKTLALDTKVSKTTPVVIWSINPDGQKAMAAALKDGSYTDVSIIPYLAENKVKLARAIFTAIQL